MVSLGLVIEQYPDDVVVFITDPRTGVQRHLKWPPTISEVVEACDKRVADLNRAKRFQNWGNNEPRALEPPREDRMTLDEMHAKYGKDWGLNLTENRVPTGFFERKTPSWDEITASYGSDPSRLGRLLNTDSST